MLLFAPLLAPAMERMYVALAGGLDAVLDRWWRPEPVAETEDADQRTEQATPRRAHGGAREGPGAALDGARRRAAPGGRGRALAARRRAAGATRSAASLTLTLERAGRAGPRTSSRSPRPPRCSRTPASQAGRAMLVLLLPLLAVGLRWRATCRSASRSRPRRSRPTSAKLNPIKGLQRHVQRAQRPCARRWRWPRSSVIVAAMAVVGLVAARRDRGPGRRRPGPGAGRRRRTSRCAASPALCWRCCVLAVVDSVFQRWQHERDLRMTKQEVQRGAQATSRATRTSRRASAACSARWPRGA